MKEKGLSAITLFVVHNKHRTHHQPTNQNSQTHTIVLRFRHYNFLATTRRTSLEEQKEPIRTSAATGPPTKNLISCMWRKPPRPCCHDDFLLGSVAFSPTVQAKSDNDGLENGNLKTVMKHHI